MEGILWLLLAALAGCVLLMVGMAVMFVIEQVAGLFGRTLFAEVEEFEDE